MQVMQQQKKAGTPSNLTHWLLHVSNLKLIVGLGNPSPQYDHTRHNVGALWVRALAHQYQIPLQLDTKFKGEVGRGSVAGVDLRLLVPNTYMNLSGEAVGPLLRFYKIDIDDVLVAYDEMAFEPGQVRLKQGGGDNGHNGLKSVRSGCGNNGNFHRLRIGVGHPGHKDRVVAYLTQHKMPADQVALVEQVTNFNNAVMQDIVQKNWPSAMNVLHTDPSAKQEPRRSTQADEE